MCWKIVHCFVFLSIYNFKCDAFWWARTTTEAPPQTVIKEIPLTYFRTYTYQPLSTNAFQLPYFTYSGMVPPPSGMHSRPRFDPYTATFLQPLSGPGSDAAIAGDLVSTTTSTTPKPTTTSTTTTTTTTTTPAPTTTTTTTPPSTTTSATASAENNNGAQYMNNVNGEYPTFNRRLYNQGNIYRPHYPYPEYFTYNPALRKESGINTNFAGARPGQVQFVPCMCPVNSGVASGIPIPQVANSIFLTQSRARTEDDSDMHLPAEQTDAKVKITLDSLEQIDNSQTTAGTQNNALDDADVSSQNTTDRTSQQTTSDENL